MPGFGWEWILVFAVLLLLFGAKRLPEMGKSLGRGMKEFKDAVTGNDDEPSALPTKAAAPEAPPPVAQAAPVEPQAPAQPTTPPETEKVSP